MQTRRWLLFTVLASCLKVCENQLHHGQFCVYNSTVTFAKPGDCSTFFRCVDYTWKDYKCPAGGVYSKKFGMCTQPEHYPQCSTPTTDFVGFTKVEFGCVYPCPEDGSVYMYPRWGQCDQFYVCKNRQLYLTRCSDIPPQGAYRFFNFFMFSCDRGIESNNVCARSITSG